MGDLATEAIATTTTTTTTEAATEAQAEAEAPPHTTEQGGSAPSKLIRRTCYLLPPQTCVNDSGKGLQKALEVLGLPQTTPFLALVDDVALPVGTLRFKAKGSSGGHNGLKDLEALFTDKYHRLKIGIGGERRIDHVVGNFLEEERQHFERIFAKAVEAVDVWTSLGPENVEKVMSVVNQVGFSKVEATGDEVPDALKVLGGGSS